MKGENEFEILPDGKPLFTPEEYEQFRAEFGLEMERFFRERYGPTAKKKEEGK